MKNLGISFTITPFWWAFGYKNTPETALHSFNLGPVAINICGWKS